MCKTFDLLSLDLLFVYSPFRFSVDINVFKFYDRDPVIWCQIEDLHLPETLVRRIQVWRREGE